MPTQTLRVASRPEGVRQGGCAFRGNHLIKHWSTNQKVVTLSSGETELTGIVKGATEALGLKSLSADLGLDAGLKLHALQRSASASEVVLVGFATLPQDSSGFKSDYEMETLPCLRFWAQRTQPTC